MRGHLNSESVGQSIVTIQDPSSTSHLWFSAQDYMIQNACFQLSSLGGKHWLNIP